MEKMAKPKTDAVFHDRSQEVHMDFNIGEFLDVRVDKENQRLTLVARAVTGDPFNVDFRTVLRNRFGSDAAERMMEEASHTLMKSQILELLRR